MVGILATAWLLVSSLTFGDHMSIAYSEPDNEAIG